MKKYKVTYHSETHGIPCNDTDTMTDWFGVLRKGKKVLARGNKTYIVYNYMEKHNINEDDVTEVYRYKK